MDASVDGNLGGLIWLHLNGVSKKIVGTEDGELPNIDEEIRWLRVLASNVVSKDANYNKTAEELMQARKDGCPDDMLEELWNLDQRFKEAELLVTSLCRKGILQTQPLPHGRRMGKQVFEE